MSFRKMTSVFVAGALLCLNLNMVILAQMEKRPVLAVMPLHPVDVTEIEARQVTLHIIDHMRRTGQFIVLDIPHIENVLKDMGIDTSARMGLSDAARAGKIISADKVITGTLAREDDVYNVQLEAIDVAAARLETSNRIKSKLSFDELPTAMAALLDPIVHPKPESRPEEPVKVEAKESVAVAEPEAVKPEDAKPVVKPVPSVTPKRKKSGFAMILGGVLVGGGLAVALLAGDKKKDSGPPPPTFGSIQVNSNPTGARIFFNGSDTGRTTNSALTDISPGNHTIRLVREGYVDVEGQIGVTAGQTSTFIRDLVKHTLSVTAPVSGALWDPGKEVEIRWTTGGGTILRTTLVSGSPIPGAGLLDEGLAAQRAAVREQALTHRMSAAERLSQSGVVDNRVGAEGSSALRSRVGGRTDLEADRISPSVTPRGEKGSFKDRTEERFVPPSAEASFSESLISPASVSQDGSQILVLSRVGIKLYRGGSEVRTIVSSTNNTGSFRWTLPSDQAEATNYKVRVFCADAPEVWGESPEFRVKRIPEIEMAYIPPGEFMMGSNEGFSDERPVHRVRITKGFWIGKYEVTQKQWQDVMGNNPSYYQKGDNYPVERVSWEDIQEFIQKLNQLTGKVFRLPTEAEWEYACRATTAGERYANLDNIAWYSSNSDSSTQPVGRKQPNGFGLYDTLGNVYEWVQDWYDSNYYRLTPTNDPPGPSSGTDRVIRGGSWFVSPQYIRAALRGNRSTSTRSYHVGFRLARSD